MNTWRPEIHGWSGCFRAEPVRGIELGFIGHPAHTLMDMSSTQNDDDSDDGVQQRERGRIGVCAEEEMGRNSE